MKVLVAHNAYQQRGGEDAVVEAEVALLRRHSHDVVEYRRHNDELANVGRLAAAAGTLWSRQTMNEAGALLARELPDVVHVHNTFPLISPSLYWAASRAHIPLVQTLHNFRLLCPQAMFLREGRVCEDCLGKLPWRGVMRACYRGSTAQSAVLASMVTLHRGLGTWRNKIARYIALNEFCRRKFIEGGLPPDRVVVKPNFVDRDLLLPQPRDGFLFVGRLSEEKGISVLVQAAAALSGAMVKVAGTGPQAPLLQAAPGIVALGVLDAEGVRAEMARSLALVLPSISYENFPLTIVEAFAAGLPVIASRLGAMADLVQDGVTGLHFEPGNAEDLVARMRWASANASSMAAMGRNARGRYEAEYTAERNHQLLIAIYEAAIADTTVS